MSALPDVDGWIIDFRTAREILDSTSNYERSHLIGLCKAKLVWLSHTEQNLFKSHADAKKHFIGDQNLIVEPDDDVVTAAISLDGKKLPKGRKLLVSDEASLMIAAAASAKGYGVISDHQSTTFATVHTICGVCGVPSLSRHEYFAAEME